MALKQRSKKKKTGETNSYEITTLGTGTENLSGRDLAALEMAVVVSDIIRGAGVKSPESETIGLLFESFKEGITVESGLAIGEMIRQLNAPIDPREMQ